jgi:predicted transposase YbfD/YdcC|tara:strand:+ start:3423 stop:3629 length:207 start_codon:yes stop_codon:yes gene_type:complete
MEKDKLDLIKKIITLVDTKEGLRKVENAVDEVLRTQWDKEAKDREEFEKWRKDKNKENSDSIFDDLPL